MNKAGYLLLGLGIVSLLFGINNRSVSGNDSNDGQVAILEKLIPEEAGKYLVVIWEEGEKKIKVLFWDGYQADIIASISGGEKLDPSPDWLYKNILQRGEDLRCIFEEEGRNLEKFPLRAIYGVWDGPSPN
ncbi:MAG: hypothetical protein PHQ20_01845 [Candidatus Moranbacteria bacterium]|jgi:hypothetical protein|nr:hypothetical protein [Candidatus Moranbacteria bacterium]